MKKIGIIGGLSPESTAKYYAWLNDGVRAALGGDHSARIVLASVDFGEFVALKQAGDWDTQGRMLADEAQALERAGADFIVLATNTMHKLADVIEAAINIPFLHLADATAARIKQAGIGKIGLLGTRYTMEQDFYKGRLQDHGIETLVPSADGIAQVSDIIYGELVRGEIRNESRAVYRDIIARLAGQGAEGIIMGCTEITMLIGQDDSPVPVFDTTKIHVEEALKLILADNRQTRSEP